VFGRLLSALSVQQAIYPAGLRRMARPGMFLVPGRFTAALVICHGIDLPPAGSLDLM